MNVPQPDWSSQVSYRGPMDWLDEVPVVHGGPVPVYEQIAASLRRQIRSGRMAGNTRLPSESELQGIHGAARGTVRHAVETLRAEGLVYTVPQRGTFVTPEPDWPENAG